MTFLPLVHKSELFDDDCSASLRVCGPDGKAGGGIFVEIFTPPFILPPTLL